MSLPNPSMDFTPFDTLPASSLDQLVENIEALAAGTGQNTSSIPASKIDFGGAGTGIWYEEIGRSALSVAGDTMSVTIPARKYLKLVFNYVATGGAVRGRIRFNADTAANYSISSSIFDGNGAANAVSVNGIIPEAGNLAAADVFQGIMEITNISTVAKMAMINGHHSGQGSGAFSVPVAWWCHWANTSTQITSIELANTQAGDFAAGAELIVLGHN